MKVMSTVLSPLVLFRVTKVEVNKQYIPIQYTYGGYTTQAHLVEFFVLERLEALDTTMKKEIGSIHAEKWTGRHRE